MHAMRQMIAAIAVRGGKPPRSFSVLDVLVYRFGLPRQTPDRHKGMVLKLKRFS
jgi:hypothetical protein